MVLSACAPISGDSKDPEPPAPIVLDTSVAWVSMREGLVQFNNGTQGVRTIGVVASKEATAPAYANVRDLPGFYTRKTKVDGTPRTVYLSMTDKMTTAKFNANVTVSVNGQATDFVSAIAAAPELLHPNTNYYAHFYEITGTTGTAIKKLEFTTENFPAVYPSSEGTYSNVYNQIRADSSSPAIEYKTSESYLIPARFYYVSVSGAMDHQFLRETNFYRISTVTGTTRPLGNPMPAILFYDLYNMTPSGPEENLTLWDEMIGIGPLNTYNLSEHWRIDHAFGGRAFLFYDNKKAVSVTE
ncbi:hypothetical protein P0082_07310 [Candidatus Haliotispira prima]|uniref:DUF4249 domain-containing protein n=1 Tax=Candidatus Haliotispira prima TaxID=3034016 RepID=A0ABY8MGI0_9SPIO|nr:hypothetical protein P0082_07310 [Candidatus Haliotispira prima]